MPSVDLIAVPTTSGTGSEVSGGSVVVDPVQGRKLGVAHPLMRAQDALVDPLLTLGLPPEPTAYTGADALAQAIGGAIVSNGNPMSLAVGLEACRHVAAGLERSVADGSRRRRPHRAEPGQPDGRPGDEPVRLRRRPRARPRDRIDPGAAARPHGRPGAGRDARGEPPRLRRPAGAGRGCAGRAGRRQRRRFAGGARRAPVAGRDRAAHTARGGRPARATSTAWWSSRSPTTA